MKKKVTRRPQRKKKIIKEHVLGKLPSEKLIKMKWNPLTEYGEDEFSRGPEHYSGGQKGAGDIHHLLEDAEEELESVVNKLSTDSNISTSDKLVYLQSLKKINFILDKLQDEDLSGYYE